MRNFLLRLSNKITKKWLKSAIGFFLCLLAVFCSLNTAPGSDFLIITSQFLHWCCSFLFGGVISYFIYFLVFLCGLGFIFNGKKKIKVNLNLFVFGCSLIVFASIILITNSASYKALNYKSLDFSNFAQYFIDSVIDGFPDVHAIKNGGIIGMSVVAVINSGMTYIGSNVIGSILLVLGAFFALAKICIKSTKVIIDYFAQTFGKKIANEDLSYDVAKNMNIDYESIKNTPEEIVEKQEPIFEEVKVDQNDLVKENKDNNRILFEETPVEVVPTVGLVKASFNFDNEKIVERKIISEPVIKKEEKIVYENDKTFDQEEIKLPIFEFQKENSIKLSSEDEANSQNYKSNQSSINNGKVISQNKDVNSEIKVNNSVFKSEEEFNSFATKKNEPALTKENENAYSNKIQIEPRKKPRQFVPPSVDLLEDRSSEKAEEENKKVCDARMEAINVAFEELGVGATITSYTCGPSVTRFDLKTEKNVSISGINKYIDDISVRLGGLDCRFVPIVQGKTTSGLEIANGKSKLVNFKDCLEHLPQDKKGALYVPFGQDIGGQYLSADLREFPHLLVCGTTGSGKSIFMHSLIMSLIMKNSVDDLKLIMIDPKRVEFGKYKEMPHLLCPPINDSSKAYVALTKLVDLMEERYSLFEALGVSNIKQYNEEAIENGKDKMPYIVLICDEFADLMDTNRKCSEPVVRLGQKSRAAGIHMIIATQRPSTNVITGTIKANLPTRVALSCSSATDSMTILGCGGAEKLLGNGDMLVMCSLISKQEFTRVQGCFVDNKEIKNVVTYLKENYETHYDPNFLDLLEKSPNELTNEQMNEVRENANDEKYEQIKQWVMGEEYASISKIQRTFSVGFPRAGKYFSMLERDGIVSKENDTNSAKGRKVLIHNYKPQEEESASLRGGSLEMSTFEPK